MKFRENRKDIAGNYLKIFKIIIYSDFSINFKITYGKDCIHFQENSWNFWNQLLEVLQKILKKFKKNWEESFELFQENDGNIIGKNWSNSKLVLLPLCRNFKKFFWNNFSEIRKKIRKDLKKTSKNVGNTSHKL